jgi:hypothetical protein
MSSRPRRGSGAHEQHAAQRPDLRPSRLAPIPRSNTEDVSCGYSPPRPPAVGPGVIVRLPHGVHADGPSAALVNDASGAGSSRRGSSA